MVLEARENAEKIGYPVIGETEKDASNVIDYNIREEITIDQSSVLNANNDTTTGMANVIPGINAPKLIANTSIYGAGGDTGSAGAILSAGIYVDSGSAGQYDIIQRQFSISSETGDLQYTQGNNGIIIPKSATYYLQVTYPEGLSMFRFDTYIMQDNEIIHYHSGHRGTGVETDAFFTHLTKGKSLRVKAVAETTGNISGTRAMSINIQSIT